MRIRVIANKPRGDQDAIDHLCGQIFDGFDFDKEDKSIAIRARAFGGVIRLNKGEYELATVDQRCDCGMVYGPSKNL